MEGQRHRSAERRRKRRRRPSTGPGPELVMIAARRPGTPTRSGAARSLSAESASPARRDPVQPDERRQPVLPAVPSPEPAPKRAARIVRAPERDPDDRDKLEDRLLTRLLGSEGRGAITRAASELLAAGFELPREQRVQLQLLEHADEAQARTAIAVLSELLQREAPIKRPVLEHRLRRLQEHAEDSQTRSAAESLRRALRC